MIIYCSRLYSARAIAFVFCFAAWFSVHIATADDQTASTEISVGWIGALTGPTAKWGTQQAALIAQEDINNSGGINGHPLKLIFEDTGCNGAKAVSAFQKLTGIDHVSFILGGHCSPDSLAFAPLAERKQILSIAAITSSPKLTTAGDYIFRVTPVSTRLAELIVPYARKTLRLQRLAIIHELTDYVVPVAEKVQTMFEADGGTVTDVISFNTGEADFRSMLTKASSKKPDAIYFGVQAPDTGKLLAKQFHELGLQQKVFGNEQFGGAVLSTPPEERGSLEQIIFAQPKCDTEAPAVKAFIEKFTKQNHVEALPFGCYTAEAYDTVELLAKGLGSCGENAPCVKKFLYETRNYPGASGSISFDANGDVNKEYELQVVKAGKIVELK